MQLQLYLQLLMPKRVSAELSNNPTLEVVSRPFIQRDEASEILKLLIPRNNSSFAALGGLIEEASRLPGTLSIEQSANLRPIETSLHFRRQNDHLNNQGKKKS